jgi:hypothetical protein
LDGDGGLLPASLTRRRKHSLGVRPSGAQQT